MLTILFFYLILPLHKYTHKNPVLISEAFIHNVERGWPWRINK